MSNFANPEIASQAVFNKVNLFQFSFLTGAQ
jgi:hypothetical protein